jgi:hypothetical protein
MPPEETPEESFLIAPGTASGKKPINVGLKETAIATGILQMIEGLPPKTPGVAQIKTGALALLKAGAAKVAKAK